MTEELERFKTAFGILHNHISAQIALGHLCGGAKSEAGQILQLAADTIHPPPEMEEVEVVRWMCDSCEEVYDMDPVAHGWARCGAELDKHGGRCDNNDYVKLTGTIKRPVKKPVVKEVSVEAFLHPSGEPIPLFNINYYPFHRKQGQFPPRKNGELIFRWTE